MDISVIAIGDELLIGQVTDTNSGWIARHINPLGWRVKSVRVIGDDSTEIFKAIDDAFAETDIVLTTGGLGPTKDDITKETLCRYFGGEMIYDKSVEANVLEVVASRNLKINSLTAAQAYVPSSCRVIQNRVGTAPIMWFEKDNKVLVSMPGVPFETEAMMTSEVIPQLYKRFCSDEYIMHRTFVVIDYSESLLAMRLADFEKGIPPYIKLAYLPKPGIIRLRFSGISKHTDILEREINSLSEKLCEILGDSIISTEDKPISAIAGDMLKKKNLTLATAESCTGGNIAHEITEIPGSSDYFMGSVVSYANYVKSSLLNVGKDILDTVGAVSRETVEQMATGVAALMNVNCAVATSGIAGPGGGTPEKPVGTVWISVFCNGKITTELHKFGGTRERVIERATTAALIMLVKSLRSNE